MNNDFSTVVEPNTLRMERLLSASVAHVWAYLIEPEKRAVWLAGGTMTDQIKGAFELHFDHQQLTEEPTPDRFSVFDHIKTESHLIAIEPMRLLTITWDENGPAASEVSFELASKGEHMTQLILTHRRLPDRPQMLSHACGWHAHLDVLSDRLHKRPPRLFWTNITALEPVYEQRIPA